jgi:hypothetical protein
VPFLRFEPPNFTEPQTLQIDPLDWIKLERFCERVEEAMTRSFAKRAPTFRRISLPGVSGGVHIEIDEYDEEELLAFLVTARHLILEKEPFCFSKSQAILRKYAKSVEMKEWIKSIVQQFQSSQLNQYMQLFSEDIPLLSEQAFQIWLNAKIFHMHPEKRDDFNRLICAFGEENTKKILVNHLSHKWFACLKLYGAIGKSIRKSSA